MEQNETRLQIPLWKTLSILIGFPVISTLLSLMLVNRSIFADTGFNFFTIFWIIITGWYALQLIILSKVLNPYAWRWSDLGYHFNKKQSIYLVGGYVVFAFLLLLFVEFALAGANMDSAKINSLSDLSDLTPKSTVNRIIFIFMGLMAGLTEELVYRGFAIKVLESYRINKWIAVVLAALPFVFQHGLKSIDQFWWFFAWGVSFGILFLITTRLYINIIIHWLVILSALIAILQILE